MFLFCSRSQAAVVGQYEKWPEINPLVNTGDGPPGTRAGREPGTKIARWAIMVSEIVSGPVWLKPQCLSTGHCRGDGESCPDIASTCRPRRHCNRAALEIADR